jgi:hypothetical protein
MDWTLIGLGVIWGAIAPFNGFMTVMAGSGLHERGSSGGLVLPLLGLNVWLPPAACLAGIAFGVGWLEPYGLWRGEAFLAAPLVSYAVIAAAVAETPLGRGVALALAALLIWFAFQPLFSQVLLWSFVGLFGLSLAGSIVGGLVKLLADVSARRSAPLEPAEAEPLAAPPRATAPPATVPHAPMR